MAGLKPKKTVLICLEDLKDGDRVWLVETPPSSTDKAAKVLKPGSTGIYLARLDTINWDNCMYHSRCKNRKVKDLMIAKL
jgi:hypothetical protein